ncbi:MAG: hypothetical protein NC830_00090 [Candidatus Omnitrophica bacterium]|nr:hypothetical protein [Candidatus Omnitrophota bacterium]
MRQQALFAVLMACLCGCASIFQEAQTYYGPDFFVCNYWIDRNQNKKIEIEEWEGIKDFFLENEHISFVAYFRQKSGTPLSFRLFAPDGSLYREKFLKQTAKTTIWCQEYEARDLINNKGTGMWKIEWYAGGQLVNITTIKILKYP